MKTTTRKRLRSVPVLSSEITATTGTVSYQAASAKSSLYRNGEVLIRRDGDGSDNGYKGPSREEREVTIRNARLLEHNQRRTIQVQMGLNCLLDHYLIPI